MTHRLIAGVVCFFWMAGFLLCQTQCLVGGSYCDTDVVSEHHPKDHSHHSGNRSTPPCHAPVENSESGSAMNCCCSVDVISPTLEKVEWHVPSEWLLVTLLVEDWDASQEVENQLTQYFYQAPWLEWALTPVLRLGPALQSLAPPQTLIS